MEKFFVVVADISGTSRDFKWVSKRYNQKPSLEQVKSELQELRTEGWVFRNARIEEHYRLL